MYITLTSHGYLSFTMNLLESIKKIDPSWKVRVYAADVRSYDTLVSLGYECVLKEFHTKHFVDYCADGYNRMCFLKLECIIDALEESEYVMYIDGDVFVLKDFRPVLEYTCDATFQCDDVIGGHQPRRICAGIMLVNRTVIPWFKEGIRDAVKYEHDQDFIQKTAVSMCNLNISLWSQSIICNGQCYENIPESALVMHYNWCVGEAEKKRRMAKNGHWFSDLLVIRTCNGIGDRLSDIIGASVIAKFTGRRIAFHFDETPGRDDREYDRTLFRYGPSVEDDGSGTEIHRVHPSISLSPLMVHRFLKTVPFHEVCGAFMECANKLVPSTELEMNLPGNLSEVYGVHLRKSDKIVNQVTENQVTQDEHARILNAMLSDIHSIIQRERSPKFFLCSEDPEWKMHIQELIEKMSRGKHVEFVKVRTSDTRTGAQDFLELFALSRCKAIFMSTKYSTFSITASLIGNVPVYNYAHVADAYPACFIHFWLPVIRSGMLENRANVYPLPSEPK